MMSVTTAQLVCLILGLSACLSLYAARLYWRKRKRGVREADVEGGGQGMPGIQQQKKRKRKLPTPPSPPFCPAAPCNTPTVRREKNKKHNKERKGKKKVVRFAKIQERTKEESTDKLHISSGRKPWSADVEVTPLEFSEQNYKRNFVTASLFAGTIHMGYSREEEGEEEGVEEEKRQFSSWRELFESNMEQ